MHNNSNCINYIIFKTKSVFEDYIMKLSNVARTNWETLTDLETGCVKL